MSKLLPVNRTLFAALLSLCVLLLACDPSERTSLCPAALAPGPDVRLRFVSAADSTDLLYIHSFHRDSIRISQPCTPEDTVKFNIDDYQQPGTGFGISVLEFRNLKSPATTAMTACFDILFRWSAADTDTVRWSYRQVTDEDGCTYYLLNKLYFNTVEMKETFDGRYRYWTAIK